MRVNIANNLFSFKVQKKVILEKIVQSFAMPIVTMKLRLNAPEELMIMDVKYKIHASKRGMALMVLLALVSALKNVRQMRLNVMYQETL